MSGGALVTALVIAAGFCYLWWCEWRAHRRTKIQLTLAAQCAEFNKQQVTQLEKELQTSREATAEVNRWLNDQVAKNDARQRTIDRQASEIVVLTAKIQAFERERRVRRSNPR